MSVSRQAVPSAAVAVAVAVVPASLRLRLIAYALDVIAVSAAILAIAAVSSVVLGPSVALDLANDDAGARVVATPGRAVIDTVLATAASALYFAGSWAVAGGTVMQRALGIRVVDRSSGARLSVGASLVRWIVLIPPFGALMALSGDLHAAPLILAGLGALWAIVLFVSALRSADRRSVHDRASGSLVVQQPDRAPKETTA